MSHATPENRLDVRMVEGIHAAALAGKSSRVAGVVGALTHASLPGLIEYLCLRHALGQALQLPPLPHAIIQSDVGRALAAVVCDFGLRTRGPFSPNTEIHPRPFEFFVLRTERDIQSHDYELFEVRWARACESAGFRQQQTALRLTLAAMSENAILHAESAPGVLVGYAMRDRGVLFTVADLGRGVLASLRSNPAFAHLRHHRDALRLALQPGVSRLGPGNGFGFHQVFKTLTDQLGTLRFRTGNVCITMNGHDFTPELGDETFPELMAGFQVTVCCRRNMPHNQANGLH